MDKLQSSNPCQGGALQLDLDKSSPALKVWTFRGPVATEAGQKVNSVIITLCAPTTLSSLEAYMYFAQVKDTSGAKQTHYQKYYETAQRFFESINFRGTEHASGVLRGMLRAAKEGGKRKLKVAMAVKIIAIEPAVAFW
jgi:hypothetical protein